ncbi:hypothetical protein BGZ98_007436 [Dissophora globulifera]|nr:hypothetical protein BGZ98_007436 [Dissophora globulifera]
MKLLTRISLFVGIEDALTCTQVCQSWTHEFARTIWHTIDFDVQRHFTMLDERVLAKYGHHIRVLYNLSDHLQVLAIDKSGAPGLRRISFDIRAELALQSSCAKIIARSCDRLEYLSLSIQLHLVGHTSQFFFDELLLQSSPLSRLSRLKLHEMAISRSSFSSLLEFCPVLVHLSMWDIVLTGSSDRYFKHQRIKQLGAPIDQIFQSVMCVDDISKDAIAPSLFIHFPNLTIWQTWGASMPLPVPTHVVRRDLTRFCPQMTSFYAQTNTTVAIELIPTAFRNLTEIGVVYTNISPELINVILQHRETLEEIDVIMDLKESYFEDNEVFTVPDHLENHEQAIQALLQLCRRLKKFSLPLHLMTMDQIERNGWSCDNLEVFWTRIKGMETKEQIHRATQLWHDARQQQKYGDLASCVIDVQDESIEARVARHLLKFPKLREVWLGAGIKRVQ